MNTINLLANLGASMIRHNVRITQFFGLLVGTNNDA